MCHNSSVTLLVWLHQHVHLLPEYTCMYTCYLSTPACTPVTWVHLHVHLLPEYTCMYTCYLSTPVCTPDYTSITSPVWMNQCNNISTVEQFGYSGGIREQFWVYNKNYKVIIRHLSCLTNTFLDSTANEDTCLVSQILSACVSLGNCTKQNYL